MKREEIHKRLEDSCPSGYMINEIEEISYPYRHIKIDALVNKTPDKSLVELYHTLLRTLKLGYDDELELCNFLGLSKDDFLLNELYKLRQDGYLNRLSGKWILTKKGEAFIKDHSIMRVLEEEMFEFLIDGVTGELVPWEYIGKQSNENKLECIDLPNKSPELLINKDEELSDLYKRQNQGQQLVDYDPNNIKYDAQRYQNYHIIEYIPLRSDDSKKEVFIEIRRKDQSLTLEKRTTRILSQRYAEILKKFSKSERCELVEFVQEDPNAMEEFIRFVDKQDHSSSQTLSVWETQSKFEEVLKTAKKKVLIESPWIKRATLNYTDLIESALSRDVKITILYGIESNDVHHFNAQKRLEELSYQYRGKLELVHLPSHFKHTNINLNGTHRKLVIKDDELYIKGSFNFLSFNKKEGQRVANEESELFRKGVAQKWKDVQREYQLKEL